MVNRVLALRYLVGESSWRSVDEPSLDALPALPRGFLIHSNVIQCVVSSGKTCPAFAL
jgi:hypothetical protein